MIKIAFRIIAFLTVGFLLIGCKNDLDILDDYRETPIIYGLLNLSDSIQYVRIQKAYLGKGDALMMAQQIDSIYYDTSKVKVVLEERINNSIYSRTLIPDFSQPKEEGLFVNLPHYVFRTEVFWLNKDASYKLIFNNSSTGKSVTGTTGIVGKITPPFNLSVPQINLTLTDPLSINFSPVNNGKVYVLDMVFNYIELNLIDSVETKKSVTYSFPEIVNVDLNSTQVLNFTLKGTDFYGFLGSHIPIDPTVQRLASKTSLDFIFTSGAEDFYIYYSLNQSSLNITEGVPDFTNLDGGKGIFSSRNKNIFGGKKLNANSLDELKNSIYTAGRFQ